MAGIRARRLSDAVLENVRLSISVAQMRAKGRPYAKIAAELGLDSPREAQRLADQGFGLIPATDVRRARRESALRLDMLIERLSAIADDPPFLVAPNGKVALDPVTGEPLRDTNAVIAALREVREVDKESRRLFGTDAPRQSVSLVAQVRALSPEELLAVVEQVQSEMDAEEQQGSPATAPPLELPPGSVADVDGGS